MKSRAVLLFALLLVAVSAGVSQDRSVRSRKMDRYNKMDVPHDPTPKVTLKVDPARLKQESDQLLFLAQSVPADIDQTTQGILAPDLKEKLKRIEKLAKQLQKEVP